MNPLFLLYKQGLSFRDLSKLLPQLLPNLKSCFLVQAADSDYEESGDLFVGPVGTSDLSAYPCHSPKTAQEDDDPPDIQGSDITRYGESNLVAEPQKVKMEHEFCFLVFS